MGAFNDHLKANTLAAPAAPTAGDAVRLAPKRHYLRSWASHTSGTPAPRQAGAKAQLDEPLPRPLGALQVIQRLEPGQAITLRASKLSVLRIAHGRVWVTLTEVGPYSRVIAGDHFLSRGDSLTLLPGQELVMEPFGHGEKTAAQFCWGPPGAVALVAQAPATANWRGGVMQPLLDLRHAAGLAARAMARLFLGLGHVFVAEVERVANYIAMIFIADSAGKSRTGSTFDAESRDASAPCRLY